VEIRPGRHLVALILALVMAQAADAQDNGGTKPPTGALAIEVAKTLQRMQRGPPYPYPDTDGKIFSNTTEKYGYHAPLPHKEDTHYYQKFVVTPPGAAIGDQKKAGLHRLMIGLRGEIYYSSDHYKTAIPIDPPRLDLRQKPPPYTGGGGDGGTGNPPSTTQYEPSRPGGIELGRAIVVEGLEGVREAQIAEARLVFDSGAVFESGLSAAELQVLATAAYLRGASIVVDCVERNLCAVSGIGSEESEQDFARSLGRADLISGRVLYGDIYALPIETPLPADYPDPYLARIRDYATSAAYLTKLHHRYFDVEGRFTTRISPLARLIARDGTFAARGALCETDVLTRLVEWSAEEPVFRFDATQIPRQEAARRYWHEHLGDIGALNEDVARFVKIATAYGMLRWLRESGVRLTNVSAPGEALGAPYFVRPFALDASGYAALRARERATAKALAIARRMLFERLHGLPAVHVARAIAVDESISGRHGLSGTRLQSMETEDAREASVLEASRLDQLSYLSEDLARLPESLAALAQLARAARNRHAVGMAARARTEHRWATIGALYWRLIHEDAQWNAELRATIDSMYTTPVEDARFEELTRAAAVRLNAGALDEGMHRIYVLAGRPDQTLRDRLYLLAQVALTYSWLEHGASLADYLQLGETATEMVGNEVMASRLFAAASFSSDRMRTIPIVDEVMFLASQLLSYEAARRLERVAAGRRQATDAQRWRDRQRELLSIICTLNLDWTFAPKAAIAAVQELCPEPNYAALVVD
jgi:guanyl-specific ribonuclease Sa